MIQGLKNVTYNERLKKQRLLTVSNRKLSGILNMVYKCLDGEKRSDASWLLDVTGLGIKRPLSWKLKLDHIKMEISHNFLAVRIINHWNRLPRHAVNSPSLGRFEIKIQCRPKR